MFLLIAILVVICGILLWHLNKDYFVLAFCRRIKTVDGSKLADHCYIVPGTTIFGNNFDVLHMNPELIFDFCRRNNENARGKSYLFHFFKAPVYNVNNAEDVEEILQSQNLITKNAMYSMLMMPFLAEGLLTSTDKKWHFRRKTLTPAFHFNILQGFLDIFKEESYKFIDLFNKSDEQIVALVDVIPQFTLNNVCETALGVKLDGIEGSEEYRRTIHRIELVIVKRLCNPLMYYPAVFYLLGDYKAHQKDIKMAHDFSSKIIEKRRKEFRERLASTASNQKEEKTDEIEKKKRYAMLDTLLDAEIKGLIDNQGICEEVNTFMFEGYDTTSTCLIFSLFNLALHPDIQAKCYQEIEYLGEMSTLKVFDFNKLEYLECVIKETLRLYPSVPFVGRQPVVDTKVNGLILPADCQINIHIYDIMRDPKHFPEPLKFDPERFFPANTVHRHPFAFVPFSAGPRNCIGQKFALLEIKVLLVAILKAFELLPVTRLEDLIFENGLVLRTQQQVKVKFVKRQTK